ncbi:MAG: Lrp/AsnC family transcriptional regulator [Candidatus Thorarchaeota archaeon]
MDLLDRSIFDALDANCRISYEELARKHNITPNAVRKRVLKLVDSGVIIEFMVLLSEAQIDANYLVAILKMDGSQDDAQLTKILTDNRMVFVVLPLSNGDFIIHAMYVGPEGLSDLGRFLRGLDGVESVEMQTTVIDRGKKKEFTKTQLKVLNSLFDDPRMSISEIAKQTSMSARRVRRTIDELEESEAVRWSLLWNPNAGGYITCLVRSMYDEKEISFEGIHDWCRTTFSDEYLYSHRFAAEASTISVFQVEHITELEKIYRAFKKIPGIRKVTTYIYFTATVSQPLSNLVLHEQLVNAGLREPD